MEVSVGIYTIIFIFFFLIIPGFIGRRFYYHGEFSKQINTAVGSLLNLIYSFFVGVILSLCFVCILNFISDKGVNIDDVLNKFDANFVSPNADIDQSQKFNGFSKNIYTIYLPFIGGVYLFSAIFGFFLSKIVLFFGCDTKWKFLRYGNNWHYLFSGKILKFKPHLDNKLKVEFTYLDILVSEKSDETTLYSGLLADYEICPYDISKLEKIHLLKATRYKKIDNTVITKNIPGNLFTIMGDKILNINCTYICFDEAKSRYKSFLLQKRLLIPFQILTTIFFLAVLVCFSFKLNIFGSIWFADLLSKPILERICLLFLLNITIGLFTPFIIDSENKQINFIGWKQYCYKILLIGLMVLTLLYVLPFWYSLLE